MSRLARQDRRIFTLPPSSRRISKIFLYQIIRRSLVANFVLLVSVLFASSRRCAQIIESRKFGGELYLRSFLARRSRQWTDVTHEGANYRSVRPNLRSTSDLRHQLFNSLPWRFGRATSLAFVQFVVQILYSTSFLTLKQLPTKLAVAVKFYLFGLFFIQTLTKLLHRP